MQNRSGFPLIFRFGVVFVVLLIMLSVGTSLLIRSSKAATISSPANVVSSPIEHTSASKAYWTTQRMKSAQPVPIHQSSSASPQSSSSEASNLLASSAGLQFTQNAASPTRALSATAFRATPVSSYNQFPASVVGKIFFHNPGTNADYVCSGTAVVSTNKSVVDTAAHCVYADNKWATEWIFCPQYQNGASSFGCWTASQLFTTLQWQNNTDYTMAFGLAVVQPLNGKALTDVVGGSGYDVGADYPTLLSLTITAYGYPAQSPFNGEQMYSASGMLTEETDGSLSMSANDMNGGSSGGPWFMTYKGTVYLIGHNDMSTSIGGEISPYYSPAWKSLLDTAQSAPN
jgi:V8-like Glu-specific endopeptidase